VVRREWATDIGPVDLLCRDPSGVAVAIEVKRRGDIDGVEQLTRYLQRLDRDPLLTPVRGLFAAQLITPQARVLAADRHIDCVTLDYDGMRGLEPVNPTLF
jgi:RecB family endonuclease NucS